MSEYKERVWGLVLANGAAIHPGRRHPDEYIEFYAGRPYYSLTQSLKAVKALGAVIDWEKTEDPVQAVGYGFTDTFHDPEAINFLHGKIVSTSGEVFEFCVKQPDDGLRFLDLLKQVLENPPSIEDGLQRLRDVCDRAILEAKKWDYTSEESLMRSAESSFPYAVEYRK